MPGFPAWRHRDPPFHRRTSNDCANGGRGWEGNGLNSRSIPPGNVRCPSTPRREGGERSEAQPDRIQHGRLLFLDPPEPANPNAMERFERHASRIREAMADALLPHVRLPAHRTMEPWGAPAPDPCVGKRQRSAKPPLRLNIEAACVRGQRVDLVYRGPRRVSNGVRRAAAGLPELGGETVLPQVPGGTRPRTHGLAPPR